MTYLFVDTNILIHYIDVDQVDWQSVTGSSGDFTIVLAPTVISELDKHKYSPNRKLSKRVKAMYSRIEGLVEGQLESRNRFRFLFNPPSQAIFAEFDLTTPDQDHQILAAILEFSRGETGKVLLVSNDIGMRMKARSLGISVIKLPDEYLLTDEPDELEKEIQLLRKETNSLKNRLPRLSVTFGNGLEFVEVPACPEAISKAQFVERKMDEVKAEHGHLFHYSSEALRNNRLLQYGISPFRLTKEQTESYNKELDKYYAECERYYQETYDKYLLKLQCVQVELKIKNAGTAPATAVDLQLEFAEAAEPIDPSRFMVREKPEPPYKPAHQFDVMTNIFNSKSFPALIRPPEVVKEQPVLVGKPLRNSNGRFVLEYQVKSVKHHKEVELGTVYVKMADMSAKTGFSINCTLTAVELPGLETCKLSVRILPQAKNNVG